MFRVQQVIDKDTLSKDDPMGEIQIPLWEMDLFNVNDNVIGSKQQTFRLVLILTCDTFMFPMGGAAQAEWQGGSACAAQTRSAPAEEEVQHQLLQL